MGVMGLSFLSLFALLYAASADVYVDVDSSCGDSCDGSESSPYPDIKTGIDAIPSGGTLIINPGTYTGEDNINITIQSGQYFFQSTTKDPQDVIIDCDNNGWAIELFSGPFYINGITIQNCQREKGGAFYIHSTFSNIINCIIQDNTALCENEEDDNHGGCGGGGIYCWSNTLFVKNSTIRDNESNDKGGGVYVESAYMLMTDDSAVYDNYAHEEGGGLYIYSGSFELKNSSFIQDNDAKKQGNDVYCESAGGRVFDESYIQHDTNHGKNTGKDYSGVRCESCQIMQDNTTFDYCDHNSPAQRMSVGLCIGIFFSMCVLCFGI